MKTKKETIPDSLPRAEVAKRIENFEVIRDSRFRMIFDLLPFELVVFLLADWLIGRGVFTGEALRFSATLMAILFLFATRILFGHAPQALGMIWDRDLIRNKNSNRHSLTEHFLSYLDRFEIALNNKRIWMFGLCCGIIGLTSTYPMLYFLQEGQFPPGWGLTGILSFYLWGNGSIINGLLGYLFGLLVWKIATISIFEPTVHG